MDLEPTEIKAIITRMKRAHGHLGSVIRMLEEGSDCESVLTQLAAVNKAISRSGYAIVATGLQQCLTETDDGPRRRRREEDGEALPRPGLNVADRMARIRGFDMRLANAHPACQWPDCRPRGLELSQRVLAPSLQLRRIPSGSRRQMRTFGRSRDDFARSARRGQLLEFSSLLNQHDA